MRLAKKARGDGVEHGSQPIRVFSLLFSICFAPDATAEAPDRKRSTESTDQTQAYLGIRRHRAGSRVRNEGVTN